MSEDKREKIEELQVLEGHLQHFLAQKQALSIESNEIDNALAELHSTGDDVYKITSGFLIKSNKERTKKELEEKRRLIVMRVESMEKQERLLEKDIARLRTDVGSVGLSKK